MHYVWRAPLALFLLYNELFSDHELHDTDRELFSDCELFTIRELHDTCTSVLPQVMHTLHVVRSAHFLSIVL